jgi:hypothetical protein
VRPTTIRPRIHLFVCTNRREGSPLGPGCGDHGEAVYEALKREVTARGLVRDAWVTRTHCLGICPRHGATVARYGDGVRAPLLAEEATPEDATRLLEASVAVPLATELAAELDALEALQNEKVLALARRLRPGVTTEDVQNPHDFPELADPDWQYADGVRAGIASVRSALAALLAAREHAAHGDGGDEGER